MGFQQLPPANHPEAAAEGGVVELRGDGVFLLRLFEEAVIFRALPDDPFKRVDLPGLLFRDGINGASGPITKALDDFEAIKFWR